MVAWCQHPSLEIAKDALTVVRKGSGKASNLQRSRSVGKEKTEMWNALGRSQLCIITAKNNKMGLVLWVIYRKNRLTKNCSSDQRLWAVSGVGWCHRCFLHFPDEDTAAKRRYHKLKGQPHAAVPKVAKSLESISVLGMFFFFFLVCYHYRAMPLWKTKVAVSARDYLSLSVLAQSVPCTLVGEGPFWGRTSSCSLPCMGHVTSGSSALFSFLPLSVFHHAAAHWRKQLSLPSQGDVGGGKKKWKSHMYWIGKNIPVVIYCCMHRSGKDYTAVKEEDCVKGQVLFPVQPQTSFRTLTLNSLWLCLLTCLKGIILPTSEAHCATLYVDARGVS